MLRAVLRYEMTIAEWIGLAALLATPYLLIGVVWAATHIGDLGAAGGVGAALSFIGATLSWPVLLIPHLCAG